MTSALRRLEGITYWVLEDPQDIKDYADINLRKEWENDSRSMGIRPEDDNWLQSLMNRQWRLEITQLRTILLDDKIVNFSDPNSGYIFRDSLSRRSTALRRFIEKGSGVIWPLVIAGEDRKLADGYCRQATLTSMGVRTTYCYVGSKHTIAL